MDSTAAGNVNSSVAPATTVNGLRLPTFAKTDPEIQTQRLKLTRYRSESSVPSPTASINSPEAESMMDGHCAPGVYTIRLPSSFLQDSSSRNPLGIGDLTTDTCRLDVLERTTYMQTPPLSTFQSAQC